MARRRGWADFMVNLDLADAVPQSANLLTTAPDNDNMTVARIIGRLRAVHTSPTAQVDSRMIVNVGIGVSSAEAFAVATAAGLPVISAADSSPARGWLWRDQGSVIKVHSTGTTYEIMVTADFHFDVGAMRKVDKGILFLIAQIDDVSGTPANILLTGLVRSMYLQ